MALGLIGRKRGMTRIYAEDGAAVPVTVVEVEPNRVTRVKSEDSDGYRAVQITTGSRHRNRITKPEAGEYSKCGVDAGRGLWEFRLGEGEGAELAPGSEVKADLFAAGQYVDVTGTTIGKGFAGTIKRHHFSMGDATHGNSLSHRAPGSIGQNQTPGKVFKGKKMSGHMGAAQRTAQALQVVRVDVDRNLLLIKGAVPGAKGGDLLIKPTTKKRSSANAN
ncbi:MAG: 50S ribosomal protein L3 [Gammaproteobacteria bacterium]|jgi:large subunit ribosomal protein L3|nr:50S ribosomal protein L3 [Gammaproteobacteria bacterium]MBI5617752.1 50S ribosomal protein L3 [Gammaproteobacteria bacterium]